MANLKCFLSAPIDVNTSSIRKVLRDLDVTIVDFYSATSDISIYNSLVRQIRQTDFAIIVIKGFNSNIFYEMGICDGLNKPIFVLIADNEPIPYFVQYHLHYRTNFDDIEILRLSLSKFSDDVKEKNRRISRTIRSPKGKIISKAKVNSFLERVKELRESGNERDVEYLVFEILKEVQLQLVSDEKNITGKRIDFVIWSDNLSLSMGNPLLVEVKAGRLSEQNIFIAENALKDYLRITEGKSGILLYLDRLGGRFRENYSLKPLIIRLDVEDLITNLAQRSFEEVILSRRNQIVHGATE
jgi:hypothetical protein